MSTKSKRSSDADLVRQEDAQRSLEDWKLLDAASLRLKCNFYNVTATGRKDTLATRLQEHFLLADETPDPASENDDPSDPTLRHRDDFIDIAIGDEEMLDFQADDENANANGDAADNSNNGAHIEETSTEVALPTAQDGGHNENHRPDTSVLVSANKNGAKKQKPDTSVRQRKQRRKNNVTPTVPRSPNNNKNKSHTSKSKSSSADISNASKHKSNSTSHVNNINQDNGKKN